jgi:uncharacterized paraquat-inducible protein A
VIKNYEKRKAICLKCDYIDSIVQLKDKKMFPKCNKCGCILNIKWTLPFSKCPIGKW